jgi:6-pyruvoyltetrahydropterin/6-carboxytetrahydropterin synthase
MASPHRPQSGLILKGYNIRVGHWPGAAADAARESWGLPTTSRERPATAVRGFMYEVTVEDTFAAGHYLRNYKGKCENPHGHNYKVRVTLAGGELDKAGLLLDFKDLKEVMKHVIDRLDHQMINDIEPFTVLNPSAENLAKYFYDETNTRLRAVTNGRVAVRDVTIYETDTTTAKYSE